MTNIGKYRHRISLLGPPVTVQQDGGTLAETETAIGDAWAEIDPMSGRETFEAQKLDHPVTHRVRVRYLTERMAARTIVWGDRRFRIESARDLGERRVTIEYLAEEG